MPDDDLLEPLQLADIFCNGVALIERADGDFYRFVLYVRQNLGGAERKIAVIKLVIPVDDIGRLRQDITRMLAELERH